MILNLCIPIPSHFCASLMAFDAVPTLQRGLRGIKKPMIENTNRIAMKTKNR